VRKVRDGVVLISRQLEEKVGRIEHKMETMIVELNRTHLKDLKRCFDETSNLKNVLNAVLEKMEHISEKVLGNGQKLNILEGEVPQVKQDTAKMFQSMEHMESEVQE
jgi:hypothetical protein